MDDAGTADLAAPDAEAAPEATAAPLPAYEIELTFPAGLVPQWKALGQITGARRRAKPARLVWHDTPDGELARHQLALAEQAGIWRLTALRPGKATWPPACPAPVLAEAENYTELGLIAELTPVASFSGEMRTVEVTSAEGTVAAQWTSGNLRGVVDEVAVAWIVLRGPAAALRPMALALADQGAGVPLASLAAQAIAVAEHTAPAPRHKGAAEVPTDTTVRQGLAFAAGQLIDAALYWAAQIPAARDAEPVHQMRVAVRRLRSLLAAPRKALTGPLWQATKAALGELARELGSAREWDVFLAGAGAEMARIWPEDRRIKALLARAQKQREAAYAALRADLAGPKMRRTAVDLALFVALRPFESEGDPAFWNLDCREFAGTALDRGLRKLRAPGDDLTLLGATELHEVRKNAKRLRYASELFASFWGGKGVRKYLDRISELQEALGEINDAASLEHRLATLGPCGFAAGVAVGLAATRARPALKDAQTAWRKLAAAEGFWK